MKGTFLFSSLGHVRAGERGASNPLKLKVAALQGEEGEKALLDCLTQKMLNNLPSSRDVWEEAEGLRSRCSYGMLYF